MTRTDTPDPVDVRFEDGRGYSIHFESIDRVPELMQAAGLRKGRCLVVSDDNAAGLYLSDFVEALEMKGWEVMPVQVPAGESSKSPRQLQRIYDDALSWPIDRKTPVIALGGGVVGDLAGFAAATLLRGLPLVQIPTTLIAQVDSAIGGKTGINHAVGKNLIGAFHQPVLVCSDPATLTTLPFREWTSGLAEVVKHALIADEELFVFLEDNWRAIMNRDTALIGDLIRRAARVKVNVVTQDEREQGLRAILNFGHTFGHAIERVAGYGVFTHGEAVALGMQAALALSHRYHPQLDYLRALRLVRKIPVVARLSDLDPEGLMETMLFDKKVEAGRLRMILLRKIGEAYVTEDAQRKDILAAWDSARSENVFI